MIKWLSFAPDAPAFPLRQRPKYSLNQPQVAQNGDHADASRDPRALRAKRLNPDANRTAHKQFMHLVRSCSSFCFFFLYPASSRYGLCAPVVLLRCIMMGQFYQPSVRISFFRWHRLTHFLVSADLLPGKPPSLRELGLSHPSLFAQRLRVFTEKHFVFFHQVTQKATWMLHYHISL
jgi:hypothetical protein